MTVYEKNMCALSKEYPGIDSLINNAKEKDREEIELEEEEALDGEKVLKVKKDGRICYLNGKRNRIEPAQIWVKSQGKLYPNAPVFVMGVGNWTYIEELVRQTENRIVIFIYEPSLQIFLYFLEHADITGWLEKQLLIFCVKGIEGMELSQMKYALKKLIKYEMLIFSRRLIVPNYDVLFLEDALEFTRECRDITVVEEVNRNTQKRFANVVAKNLLANIRFLADGYKTTQLSNMVPVGVPGILVAAGPSLNKNIEELKKAKGKAFIFAVDTAVKPLLKAGIVPDMFAIVDGKKPLDLVQADGADRIPLVTTIVAASEVLSYHKGMKFFACEGYQLADEILFHYEWDTGSIPSGGSVANTAFGLMRRIGVRTIILVGQDLAMTGNRTHADGTFQEKMEEIDTRGYIMVEGNCEEKVPTRPDFKVYLEWYEMYIEGCKKEDPGFRVINATEGGAKIRQTEVMTLKEAIRQECRQTVDIQSFLNGLKPMFHTEQDKKWVQDHIDSIPERCRTLNADAKKTVGLYKKLDKICGRKNIDRQEYQNLLKKLAKQIRKVEAQAVYDLVEDVMSEAQYIIKNEQFLDFGTPQEEGKEIARKGILYMENVARCAEIFRQYVDEIYQGGEGQNVQ